MNSSDLISIEPHDDRLPVALGRLLDVPTVSIPLGLQHGNVLSNGRGLLLTTSRVLDDNAARGYDEEDVTGIFRKYYGAREVVFLLPLIQH